MTSGERPVCDCTEPCGCYAEGYAAGKDKAYSLVLASLDGPPYAESVNADGVLTQESPVVI